ncbi:MAG TPA: hypothetical protein VGM18_15975 [Candidatus Sulfotelmatobacter sp.]|jgi:hypothetical protein
MDLRKKYVLFRLSWRGRRELKGIEFFADKKFFEARVVSQDTIGVWIQPAEVEPAPTELLKWEYIAAATVHYQEEPEIPEL